MEEKIKKQIKQKLSQLADPSPLYHSTIIKKFSAVPLLPVCLSQLVTIQALNYPSRKSRNFQELEPILLKFIWKDIKGNKNDY